MDDIGHFAFALFVVEQERKKKLDKAGGNGSYHVGLVLFVCLFFGIM